ncbi:hypothetical protein [Cellulophaga sp. Z1A5H]|uniref:hypothetical protein n=1 Tax=Cellulophaga sp. Z1A5H TaxID=2687291 RepID=UPI0013FDA790|nr:hypothetical protein [Cellulophaga sp. Z1A5H]
MNRILLIIFLIISKSIFSQNDINQIPESCLYYFYEFSFRKNDKSIQIKYPEKTGFNSGKNPPYKSYYSKNESIPYNQFTGDSVKAGVYEEELKKFINLEFVDEKIKNFKKYNKYEITDKLNIKTNKFGEFYLPIGNKKDSIHFKDTPIEAYTTTYSYIGEMECFDSYLVETFFEQPSHLLVNKKNGSKTEISSGIPNYSPNGIFLLDIFANTATYQHNESAYLSLSRKNKNNKLEGIIWVSFKSWAPSSNYKDYFWISENEIVFKVFPIRKYIEEPDQNLLKSQYLKLKIL